MGKLLFCGLFLISACCLQAQKSYEIGLRATSHINTNIVSLAQKNLLLSDGYSIGLRAAKSCKRTSLQSGLLYSNMNMGTLSYQHGDSKVPELLSMRLECIEVQTLMKHHFNDYKKIIPFFSGGLSNFIIIGRNNYQPASDPQGSRNNGEVRNSGYNLAVLATCGIRCKLDGNFSVDLEPELRYFVFRNTNYKHNLSPAFGVTLSYRFHKSILETDNIQ